MAAYIPEDKITEIKNASDIVAIVSEFVSLRRAGRNFLGSCPFHAEKTPSFTVSPDKQIFYCFGCGAGGNVFSFLMKHQGLTFPEAVRSLANRYGIRLPTRKMSPADKKKLTERESIVTLNGDALKFYRDCLFSKNHGQRAMDYLRERGMRKETIDDFDIGFAPDGWDHLTRFLGKKKRSVTMAALAGLIIPRKKGSPVQGPQEKGQSYYDRFRNRIIFPIFNAQSQPVGFGGRVMDDALPKYLNSPETPVYNKRRSLYGLNRARQQSRQSEAVYVVEGYFDLLTMHQFGISNTVATLGTSLTLEHVQILKGLVGQKGEAILVFDSDQAGVKAAQRSVAVFQKGLLAARVLVLPKDQDPDSFIMKNGAGAFLQIAKDAKGMMDFMVASAIAKYGLTIEGKVRIINDLKDAILAIGDPVERALRVKQLSERMGVEESILLQKVRQGGPVPAKRQWMTGRPDTNPKEHRCVSKPKGETYRLERQMVAMMLQYPEMIPYIAKHRYVTQFADPLLEKIGKGIIDHFAQSGSDVAGLVSRWTDVETKAMVARLSLTDEQWDKDGCMNLINQFHQSIRRRDKSLLQRIEAAEKSGDVELLASLLQEKQHQAQRVTHRHGGADTRLVSTSDDI